MIFDSDLTNVFDELNREIDQVSSKIDDLDENEMKKFKSFTKNIEKLYGEKMIRLISVQFWMLI